MKQMNLNMEEPSSAGQPERRHVYNGDSMKQHGNSPKGNRPVRSRKRSPFMIVLGLFGLSLMVVLYIWNKISVNNLAIAVNELHNQHEKILNTNEFLRVEINKKSSLERIGKIAVEQLGLVSPKEQPVWFEINQAAFEELQKTQ
jgi:cell division protein FtsL